jgi:hypothetical protein
MLKPLIPLCHVGNRKTLGSILLWVVPVVSSFVEPTAAADGLVASWSFDGTLRARSGGVDELIARGVRGEPRSARFVSAEELPGVSGRAVALGVEEGDAQWLTAPLSEALRLSPEYTIEAWIHPVHLASWGRLVLRWGAAPNYAYHVAIHEGRASLYHNQSNGEYLFAEGGRVHIGRWHHLAAVARPHAQRPSESARAEALERLEADRRRQDSDRRAQLLAGLEFDGCEEIVFAERGAGRDPGGHYYANFGYASVDPDLWVHGADGGRLLRLNVRTGELVPLLDDPGGAVRDPVVHYDGGKILFSYRRAGSSHYPLYEIDADGSKLRQLTDGPFDDIEPAYLPDGVTFWALSDRRTWRYGQHPLLFDANNQRKPAYAAMTDVLLRPNADPAAPR